jgi:hypothetical protein
MIPRKNRLKHKYVYTCTRPFKEISENKTKKYRYLIEDHLTSLLEKEKHSAKTILTPNRSKSIGSIRSNVMSFFGKARAQNKAPALLNLSNSLNLHKRI